MRIDIVTLFPELCDSFLSASILGRARAKNLFEAHCHQIRGCTPSLSPTACGLCRPSAPGRAEPSPMSCS